jgi:type IV secretory pathway protease TraF
MHLVIPKNQYYLLGDNRDESDDSRRFGSIHKESIIYKIVK